MDMAWKRGNISEWKGQSNLKLKSAHAVTITILQSWLLVKAWFKTELCRVLYGPYMIKIVSQLWMLDLECKCVNELVQEHASALGSQI